MSQPLHHLSTRFTGLWVRQQLPYGQVLGGRDDTGAEVTVAVLTGAAAVDPRVRNAFADVVWRDSIGSGGEQPPVTATDLNGAYPWAAVRVAPGGAGAEQLLTELGEAIGTTGHQVPPPPPIPPGLPAASASPAYHPTSPSTGDTAPVVYAPMGATNPTAGSPPGGYPVPTSAPTGYGAPPGYAPGGAQAGYPGGTPGGYPATGHPPQPPARSDKSKLVIGLVGGFLALLLAGACGVVAWQVVRPDAGNSADPLTQGGVSTSPTGDPSPSTSPSSRPTQPTSSDRPQLRPVEPMDVLGATFPRNADTYTMAFTGWPFAFRTPGTWGCLRGTIHRWPDLEAWQCIDESRANPDHILVVTLWDCPDGCTRDTQQELIETWLDFPDRAERAPHTPTYYVESEYRNDADRLMYSVDLSHFTAGPEGGELRWMVGVYGESPYDGREIVQQIINDIITQAG